MNVYSPWSEHFVEREVNLRPCAIERQERITLVCDEGDFGELDIPFGIGKEGIQPLLPTSDHKGSDNCVPSKVQMTAR